MNTVKYLEKNLAKVTIDFSAQRAIDSAYTFDAADINETADTITITGHPYKVGDLVGTVLTATTGVTATAPAMSTAYYVIVVDNDTIALATSLANAKAGTKVALTAGSAADVYLQRECFGAVKTDLVVPKGAIVTDCFTDVITTFKSWDGAWGAGNEDKATMALHLLSANDVLSAIAIEAATNVFDAGQHGTIVGATPLDSGQANITDITDQTGLVYAANLSGTFLKMTSDAELTATIAVDPISQGKIDIYLEKAGLIVRLFL
jgi:flagellin-like hook-associated protein FlgL